MIMNINHNTLHNNSIGAESPVSMFVHRLRVTIGDTHVFGGVYYARIIAWQGETRERWLMEAVDGIGPLIAAGLRLATVEVSCRYCQELHLGDLVRVVMRFEQIGRCTARLRFDLIRESDRATAAWGMQKVLCTDIEGRPRHWPNAFREAMEPLLMPDSAVRRAGR